MTTTPIVSPPLRAVLFDMDGTLIDSTENGNRAWTTWADEAGIVDRSFQETYRGRPGRQVLAEIVPPDQIEAAFLRGAVEAAEGGTLRLVIDVAIEPVRMS